jgi:hypothetical protein
MRGSRYDKLRDYLMNRTTHEIILSFADIEKLIGVPLPKSAERPQWWANVKDPDTTHVQRKSWGAAGYDAFLMAGSSKVRFVKVK